MTLSVITVTRHGAVLARRVSGFLRQRGYTVRLLVPQRFHDGSCAEVPFTAPLTRIVAAEFKQTQGMVFIMALGIVIRLLAPLARDKRKDPAVVVLDEKGRFVISALSGHLGGANDLARELAHGLGATAVITTATDVQGRPAVDVLARQYALVMEPFTAVRAVNAALVNEETVTFCSQFPLPLPQTAGVQTIPWEQFPCADPGHWLVLITNRTVSAPTAKTLFLRPRNLVAGIGCRRDIAPELLREALNRALAMAARSPSSLRAIATVDLRLNETALHNLAEEMSLPLLGFSREQISRVYEQTGTGLSFSDFVYKKIGVGGVCEPVTLLTSPHARLILRKTSYRGTTIALAEENSGWWEPAPAIQPI